MLEIAAHGSKELVFLRQSVPRSWHVITFVKIVISLSCSRG